MREALRLLADAARRERRPVLVPRDLDSLDDATRAVVTEGLRAVDLAAVAVLPLRAADGSAGWTAVGWDGARPWPRPPADAELLAVLEAGAHTAAQTVDRARRDDRERALALTLQLAVLPVVPPTLPGIDLRWRYESSTDGSLVGGDWYDAIDLGDGHVALVVGDVAGHGISAVAAMTRLRNALGAYLVETRSPGLALARLNRLVASDPHQSHATVVCGVLDIATLELRQSLAGHPPPVIRREGSAQFAPGRVGPPIGVRPDAVYPEESLRLDPGDTLLLYTDGLIERRREGLQLEALVETVREAPADPEELIEAVGRRFLTGGLDDDAALLALSVRRRPRTSQGHSSVR
jgi:hypothetical protein